MKDKGDTKLITFTGPPCSGKTSVMNGIKDLLEGKWFYIDEVTRWVKRKYGTEINEDGKGIDQWLMINRHINNALYPVSKAEEQYTGIILNRCILDTMVFSEWAYAMGKIDKWLYDYNKKALSQFMPCYDLILYPDPDEIENEDDGVRSANGEFRKDIRAMFEDYFRSENINYVKLSGTNEERVERALWEIQQVIQGGYAIELNGPESVDVRNARQDQCTLDILEHLNYIDQPNENL
jgi:thymidylate kinase